MKDLVRQQTLAVQRDAERFLADFGEFLRLNVAQGDASQHTVRNYHTQAALYVAWCQENGINPATATEDDLRSYRKALVQAQYKRSTIAFKLGVVRRLYEAAQWRGLRMDNPASGLRAPKERTAREERIKFLPLDGLSRMLDAPQGEGAQARRDRALLALMGKLGLRVAEVATLQVNDLDLDRGTLRVTGKGRKTRTVYLTEQTVQRLTQWLAVREDVAQDDVDALFVVTGNHTTGTAMSRRALRYLVDGYLEDLDLKEAGVSCHALRHSAATWSRAGGAKIDAIADQLGHASTDTTRIYARIVDRMSENPARFLEAILSG